MVSVTESRISKGQGCIGSSHSCANTKFYGGFAEKRYWRVGKGKTVLMMKSLCSSIIGK